MALKSYLTSDGKISASMVEDGAGGTPNIEEVLIQGNDANGKDLLNVGNFTFNSIEYLPNPIIGAGIQTNNYIPINIGGNPYKLALYNP